MEDDVDIDLSFTERTDEIEYSTDECVKDRLETIKNQSEEDKLKILTFLKNQYEKNRLILNFYPNQNEKSIFTYLIGFYLKINKIMLKL